MGMVEMREAIELRDALSKAVAGQPVDNSETMAVLTKIASITVTVEVLTKTKIGRTVNHARKKPGVSLEAQALAKKIARQFKALMDQAGPARAVSASSSNGGGDGQQQPTGASVPGASPPVSTSSASPAASTPSSTPASLSAQHGPASMDVPTSGDKVRDGLRRVLCQALCTDGPNFMAPQVAADIEIGVFAAMGYPVGKGKIRTIVSNLKNKDNSILRARALNGDIPGANFATMTADDLASDKVKATKAAAAEQFLKDKALAEKEGAHTTEYPCPKCKKRDCIYTQLQTRSADEPMTTFCCCKQCGTRWKFC